MNVVLLPIDYLIENKLISPEVDDDGDYHTPDEKVEENDEEIPYEFITKTMVPFFNGETIVDFPDDEEAAAIRLPDGSLKTILREWTLPEDLWG